MDAEEVEALSALADYYTQRERAKVGTDRIAALEKRLAEVEASQKVLARQILDLQLNASVKK